MIALRFFLNFLLLVGFLSTNCFAEYKYNPYTGKLDYYEPSSSSEGLSSFTSPNSTLTIGGTLTDPTVDINLTSQNNWEVRQNNTDLFVNNHNTDWSLGPGNDVVVAAAGSTGSGAWIGLLWDSTNNRIKVQDELAGLYSFEADSFYGNNAYFSNQVYGNFYGLVYPSGFTQHYVAFGGSGGSVSGDAKFTFNTSTNRLLVANSGITAQNQLHLHQSGATSLYEQFTNSATGSASTDGLQIGVTSAGIAEINQKESSNLRLFTANTQRVDINSSGQIGLLNSPVSGSWGAVQVVGSGTSVTASPLLLIKHTTDDSAAKSAGITTETRMTSRYLRTWQNAGNNDNSFGNAGVINWTAWEYSNSAFSTLVAPTEFKGWNYQYYDGSAYQQLLKVGISGVGIGMAAIGTVPSAKLHVIGTTEQFRLGYDTTNYFSTTLDSAANATLNLTASSGTPEFTFSDAVNVPNDAYAAGWNSNTEVPTKDAVYDQIEVVKSLMRSIDL